MNEDHEISGIEYLKFISVWIFITNHATAYMSFYRTDRLFGAISGEGLNDILGIALGSLTYTLPATAVAVFRVSLSRNFVGTRLMNFPLKKVASLAGALCLIESLKQGLVFGPKFFFSWSVLHFIGISLLLLALLSRVSIVLVGVAGLATLFLTPWIQKLLIPLQILTVEQTQGLNATDFVRNVLLALSAIAFPVVGVAVFKAKSLPSRLKAVLGAVLAAAFVGAAWILPRFTPADPEFSALVYNLPTGILVGNERLQHIWPFFPWFSLQAFAFVWVHILLQKENRARNRLILLALSTAMLAYFLATGIETFVSSVSSNFIFGAKHFQAEPNLALGVMGLFGLLFLLCGRVAKHRGRISNSLSLWSVYSRTVFWIYLFATTIGVFLAKPFAQHIPSYMAAMYSYDVVMIVLSYLLGVAVVRLVGAKRYRVSLKPATPAVK